MTKKKDIWVIGIETGLYEDEEGKETLVQICPKEGDYYDCEIFMRPIEELDYWTSKIGQEVDMDEVYEWKKGTDGIPDIAFDSEEIKKRIKKRLETMTIKEWIAHIRPSSRYG